MYNNARGNVYGFYQLIENSPFPRHHPPGDREDAVLPWCGAAAFFQRRNDLPHWRYRHGLVLTGSVLIENNDLWGNTTVLDSVGPGQIFAETYACTSGEPLMVNVVAAEPVDVLFLNMDRVLQVCSHACTHHNRLIRNLLSISAQKNLNLSRKIFHTASKSIRGRLSSYLSYQAIRSGSHSFTIPFNRQQLADYLNVDRSALSNELSKMQKEGLLKVDKSRFELMYDSHGFGS